MPESAFAAGGALIGIVIGALIRGSIQHRRWLRDYRAETYAAFLHATDRLNAAIRTYIETVRCLLERTAGKGEESQQRPEGWWRQTPLADDLTQQWEEVCAARDELRRQEARIELLAPDGTYSAALFVQGRHLVATDPTDLNHLEEGARGLMLEECRHWEEEHDKRSRARRRFLRCARGDLRVHPWDPFRPLQRLMPRLRPRRARSGAS